MVHTHFKKITLLSFCVAAVTLHADPFIFLKNNSNRLISVQPIMRGMTPGTELVKPEQEYTFGDTKSGLKLDGIIIRYCPSSYSGDACNVLDMAFNKYSKAAQFNFTASAEKYYLKVTIDKNDTVSLEPQKGGLFGRSTHIKWGLGGNITKGAIQPVESQAPVFAPRPAVAKQPAVQANGSAVKSADVAQPAVIKTRPVSQVVQTPSVSSVVQEQVYSTPDNGMIVFTKRATTNPTDALVEAYVEKVYSPEEINKFTSTGVVGMKRAWNASDTVERKIATLEKNLDWGKDEVKKPFRRSETDEQTQDIQGREEDARTSDKSFNAFYYLYKLNESELLNHPQMQQNKQKIKAAIEVERDNLRALLKHKLPSGRYVVEYLDEFNTAN